MLSDPGGKKASVKALEAQAEIFRQEARDRAQSETKQLIENIIHRASGLANDIRSRCHWWNKQSYTHRRKGQDTISDTDEEWGF